MKWSWTKVAGMTVGCGFVLAVLASCDSTEVSGDDGSNVSASMGTGPNQGYVYKLVGSDGGGIGIAEIKLHDDKGDLEVWLNRGSLSSSMKGDSFWDLPLDSQLTVEFPDLGKEVILAVRDDETNANEDGESMIRDGKTNYFIFPGDTGEDASWLQGHHFEAVAVLSFEVDGSTISTEAVELVPHGHHGDGGHAHPHPH